MKLFCLYNPKNKKFLKSYRGIWSETDTEFDRIKTHRVKESLESELEWFKRQDVRYFLSLGIDISLYEIRGINLKVEWA